MLHFQRQQYFKSIQIWVPFHTQNMFKTVKTNQRQKAEHFNTFEIHALRNPREISPKTLYTTSLKFPKIVYQFPLSKTNC